MCVCIYCTCVHICVCTYIAAAKSKLIPSVDPWTGEARMQRPESHTSDVDQTGHAFDHKNIDGKMTAMREAASDKGSVLSDIDTTRIGSLHRASMGPAASARFLGGGAGQGRTEGGSHETTGAGVPRAGNGLAAAHRRFVGANGSSGTGASEGVVGVTSNVTSRGYAGMFISGNGPTGGAGAVAMGGSLKSDAFLVGARNGNGVVQGIGGAGWKGSQRAGWAGDRRTGWSRGSAVGMGAGGVGGGVGGSVSGASGYFVAGTGRNGGNGVVAVACHSGGDDGWEDWMGDAGGDGDHPVSGTAMGGIGRVPPMASAVSGNRGLGGFGQGHGVNAVGSMGLGLGAVAPKLAIKRPIATKLISAPLHRGEMAAVAVTSAVTSVLWNPGTSEPSASSPRKGQQHASQTSPSATSKRSAALSPLKTSLVNPWALVRGSSFSSTSAGSQPAARSR